MKTLDEFQTLAGGLSPGLLPYSVKSPRLLNASDLRVQSVTALQSHRLLNKQINIPGPGPETHTFNRVPDSNTKFLSPRLDTEHKNF